MDTEQQRDEGIAAFRAGDKATAQELLEQVVNNNADDAKAWYYLAGTYDDIEKRRYALEQVLRLMPNNQQAQEELDKLPAASGDNMTNPDEADADEDPFIFDEPESNSKENNKEDSPVSSSATASDDRPPQRAKATATAGTTGDFPGGLRSTETGYQRRDIPKPQQGFELPVNIPGAPEKVDFQYLTQFFIEKVKAGVAILQRDLTVYVKEIQRSNWWEFWGYVGIAYLLIGLLTTFGSFMTDVFSATRSPSAIILLTTFLLLIPLGIAALYAGIYASHWWVTNQRNGQGSLAAHANTIALPVVTASLISNALSFAFSVLPFLLAVVGLVTLALSIYALFIAVTGLETLHKIDRGSAVWTVGIMILAQLAASFAIGLILSPFLIASAFSAI